MPFIDVRSDCMKCDLYKTCKTPNIQGRGCTDHPDIMFVGEAPGKNEDIKGKVFIGDAGNMLKKLIKELKFNLSKIYITNAVACRPENNRKPKQKEIKACLDRLKKEIRDYKPKVVVMLGDTPLQALTGRTGISKQRLEDLGTFEGAKLFATFHPAYLLYNASAKDSVIKDLKLVKRYLQTGKGQATQGKRNYTILESDAEVKRFLVQLVRKENWITFDIETVGLDPLASRARLLSIAFSTKSRTGTGFLLKKSTIGALSYKKRLRWLNLFFKKRKGKLVGHNAQFDCKYLFKFGVTVGYCQWDTQLGHYLMDETYAMPSLKQLARLYTDMGNYDEELQPYKDRLDSVPEDKLLCYNCADVDATFRILELELKALSVDKKFFRVMSDILMPASRALGFMELTGIELDVDHISRLTRKYSLAQKRAQSMLWHLDPVKRTGMHFKKRFNPDSDQQVRYLIYKELKCPESPEHRTDSGLPSTSVEALKLFQNKYPKLITLLIKLSKVNKMLSTYIGPALDWRGEDGRVHTTYNLCKTVTGRLSSEKPNSQNFPRDKEIKRMVRPREGNYIINADYSQLELRIMACAAKDERLIKIYKEGLDAHRMAAAAMFNVEYDEVTKDQRQEAKGAVSFGLNYGRQARGLAQSLKISVDRAEQFRRDYFVRYAGVKRYIGRIHRTVKEKIYVSSLFGRRRRLPDIRSDNKFKRAEAQRMAVNHVIQSTASDITLMALDRIILRIQKEKKKSRLVFTIHDSVVLDVPKNEVKWCCKMLKEEMEQFEFPWLIVPLEIDIEIMRNWGDKIAEWKDNRIVKTKK